MVIEIFELICHKDTFVIDPKRPIATITIQDGRGEFQIFDKEREEMVRRIFERKARVFVGGGGGVVDGAISYPAWSPEAVQASLKALPAYAMGGRIVSP